MKFPLNTELVRRGYQWCTNRILIDEKGTYSLQEIISSNAFMTIIRQRLINNSYYGLGLAKISMRDEHYTILDNMRTNGVLKIADGALEVAGHDSQ